MRTEVGVMLTGGLLALAGCGGGTKVVTKTVTSSNAPAVSQSASTPTTAPATTTAAPSAAATAAVRAFAAATLAANVEQAVAPAGAAIFAPAFVAAAGTIATAQTSGSGHATTPAARPAKVVAGNATGQYAVAYTSGTFHHPSQIVLSLNASPPQPGSVDWNVVCFETSGGIGRKEGRATLQLPTTKTLPLPAPSSSCIASANVQLSGSGTVSISITG